MNALHVCRGKYKYNLLGLILLFVYKWSQNWPLFNEQLIKQEANFPSPSSH